MGLQWVGPITALVFDIGGALMTDLESERVTLTCVYRENAGGSLDTAAPHFSTKQVHLCTQNKRWRQLGHHRIDIGGALIADLESMMFRSVSQLLVYIGET